MKTEQLIISGLIGVEDFKRKALPHIKSEYFSNDVNRIAYGIIEDYEMKYGEVPKKEAFDIELENREGLTESQFTLTKELSDKIYSDKVQGKVKEISVDWLVDTTEEYCLQRSVYDGVWKAVQILEGSETQISQNQIPQMLQDALKVSFNTSIGHDYFADAEGRYEFYNHTENKLAFPLEMLNRTTKGGLANKTLNLIVAPTGVGKTLFMTYFSSHYLMEGKNVLYVTLEMAEERIGERIDSALMDCRLDDLKMFEQNKFQQKIESLQKNTLGSLIIKEYPTGSVSVSNLHALLDELKTKKNFIPDVLVIDYLNLLKSNRMKSAEQSYNYVKAVTEELRGFCVQHNLVGLSATQTNRSGMNSSSFDLTEVSDSAGIAFTADWMLGVVSEEELEKNGHLRCIQLKNRYGPLTPKSFLIGVDRSKMKLFDLDIANVDEQLPSPVFDNTNTGKSTGKLKF